MNWTIENDSPQWFFDNISKPYDMNFKYIIYKEYEEY